MESNSVLVFIYNLPPIMFVHLSLFYLMSEIIALYKKIVNYFQSDDVAEVIKETYKGSYVPAWQ